MIENNDIMEHLQKAAHEAVSSGSSQDKMESLSRAFEIFSLETVRLETSYDSLSDQFQQINLELQDANHELQNKVAELDIITDYLKSILDNIVQGILFIETSGVIRTCNPAAETILGVQSNAIVQHLFRDSFADNAFGFSMKEALGNSHESGTYSVGYAAPSGRRSELEIVTTYASAGKNNVESPLPLGMIVMIRDVTEVRRLQRIAARADRMKVLGEMAAQVAHEIRNPLGGIRGFASLLQRDLADQPHLQQMASYIVDGTNSLNNLVSQVLHYARPVQPQPENTDMIALLRDVKNHVEADTNIFNERTKIDLDTESKTLFLSIDPALMKSALLNLIVNSLQAMPNGGTVTLFAREMHGQAIIGVADTGSGITEENISKLFSPFFTTKPEGNGLGLIEVQKVVQAHGGTIDFDTEPGRGTTFRLLLPARGHSPSNTRIHL